MIEMKKWGPKDPKDIINAAAFDFALAFPPGFTFSPTIPPVFSSAPPDLLFGGYAYMGTRVLVQLQGGNAGTEYTATCFAHTTDGNALSRSTNPFMCENL